MPKLFFRKKGKKKAPRIKDALASLPALVAVPASPTPGSPSATQEQLHSSGAQQDRLDSTLTSSIGTQSKWPPTNEEHHRTRGAHSLPEPPLSEDEELPGYATVKRPQNKLNNPASHRTKELTTQLSSSGNGGAGSQAQPRERLLSSSELPSVTSGLSLHSDSSDNFVFHPPPHSSSSPKRAPPPSSQRSSQRQGMAEAVTGQRSLTPDDENISQLYAKVQKPKKHSELPPKAPLSLSSSPPQHSGQRYKEKSRYHQREAVDSSPQHNKHDGHSSLRERLHLDHSDEALVPEYSDDDYLPSDEASESIPSPLVSGKHRHQRSASYPNQHQLLPNSAKRGNPNLVLSQSAHLSPNTTIHPYTPPAHQNQTYFFSEKHPDGSVQYYTARPVLSPAPPPSPATLQDTSSQAAPVEPGYYSNVPGTLLFHPASPVRPSSREETHPGTSPAHTATHTRHDSQQSSSHMQNAHSDRPLANTSHSSSRRGGAAARDDGNSSFERRKMYKDLVRLYGGREAKLKAQVEQLEAANTSLAEKNQVLKRQYHTARKSEAQSSESMQRQISTLAAEKSKSDLSIKNYELELSHLKEEISKLQEENKLMLHSSLSEESGWEEVAAHAQSVLQENCSLLDQQEALREARQEHQATIQQLKAEMAKLRKERAVMKEELGSLREGHGQLEERFHTLGGQSAKQVALEEHQQAMEEVQSLLEELADKAENDSKIQEARLRVLQKEKKELVRSVTDSKAVITRFEGEIAASQKANRKLQEKLARLQSELEEYRDREVASHHQLNKAVALAERAMTERDTFAKIAKGQQKAQERRSQLIASNKQAFKEMEGRLESYKTQANHKLDRASLLLKEHERQQRSERSVYEDEIRHLKALLEAREPAAHQGKGPHHYNP